MNKLLIVVDMQNDFIIGSLGTKEAQEIVPRVRKKIEEWNGDIIFTQDTHFDDYLDTREGKRLPIKHCIYAESGWDIDDLVFESIINKELKSILNKKNIRPFQKEYFSEYEFLDFIDDKYDEIEVVGLCTNICVLANVLLLQSKFHEANIIVDASCCAGSTPELHEAALKVMESCQIEVINNEL